MRFNKGLESFNLSEGTILVFRNQEDKRSTAPTSRDAFKSLNIHYKLVYFLTDTMENTGGVEIVQVNIYLFEDILCFGSLNPNRGYFENVSACYCLFVSMIVVSSSIGITGPNFT